jgi:hypothetical protein
MMIKFNLDYLYQVSQSLSNYFPLGLIYIIIIQEY